MIVCIGRLPGRTSINALAESIIGLVTTEGTKFLGPWRSMARVEWETLKWLDRYNKTRLQSAIGLVTPNEAEEAFHASWNADENAAQSLTQKPSGKPEAVYIAK